MCWLVFQFESSTEILFHYHFILKDINECDEMKTECEFCENLYGGYECTCPDGYELNDDEKTCRGLL